MKQQQTFEKNGTLAKLYHLISGTRIKLLPLLSGIFVDEEAYQSQQLSRSGFVILWLMCSHVPSVGVFSKLDKIYENKKMLFKEICITPSVSYWKNFFF